MVLLSSSCFAQHSALYYVLLERIMPQIAVVYYYYYYYSLNPDFDRQMMVSQTTS